MRALAEGGAIGAVVAITLGAVGATSRGPAFDLSSTA